MHPTLVCLIMWMAVVVAVTVVSVYTITEDIKTSLRHLTVHHIRPWNGTLHATYIEWNLSVEGHNCTIRDHMTTEHDFHQRPIQTVYQTDHCDSLDPTDAAFAHYDLHCLTKTQWARCRRFQARGPLAYAPCTAIALAFLMGVVLMSTYVGLRYDQPTSVSPEAEMVVMLRKANTL